jgi:hypothetical protein
MQQLIMRLSPERFEHLPDFAQPHPGLAGGKQPGPGWKFMAAVLPAGSAGGEGGLFFLPLH